MITKSQAESISYRDEIYSLKSSDSRGFPHRIRVNGKLKTWKRDEVIVGNVGTIYAGDDRDEAFDQFRSGIWMTRDDSSRAFQEDVTLMQDGGIVAEYIGEQSRRESLAESL